MSEDAIVLEPAPALEGELDESSLTSALYRLQEMHVSLRKLRTTIPRLVDSVLVAQPDPEVLHSDFTAAATTAAQEIKDLSRLMDQPRNKEVLEKAKESRDRNNEGVRAWLVAEHDSWLDVKKDESDDAMGGAESGGDFEPPLTEVKNSMDIMNNTLETFKKTRPSINAKYEPAKEHLEIKLPSPANLTFIIEAVKAGGSISFNVKAAQETKQMKLILESIDLRRKRDDLKFLLEMIASYADVKSKVCVKCSRLVDYNGSLPLFRSRKRTKHNDGGYFTHWQAFHKSCR